MIIKPANRLNSVEEYYFSTKLKEIRKMQQSGIEIINLGIGSPDMAPEEKLISKLMEESVKKSNHAYQSYTGIDELREAFSDFYRNHFGVNLSKSEFLPLMGSKEGIMHISMAFLNPGDGVLVPDPGYPTYEAVSNLLDATVTKYQLTEANNWYPDFKSLEKQDLSRVKLMWVNYPNMPTGSKATGKLFQQLVDFGIKHQILIVNDNPYSFILNPEQLSILSANNAKKVAIELNSLSKSHNMSGWRVGVLAGNEKYIQTVLRVKSNMDSGMFKPIQLAAVCALNTGKSWYNSINKVYAKRREVVFGMLNTLDLSYNPNQVGMFVWAKIPDSFTNAEHFSDLLLQQAGIFITPGSVFGTMGKNHVRVSLCADEEVLNKAGERIHQFVSSQNKNVLATAP